MILDGIWTTEILGAYDIENLGIMVFDSGRAVGGNDSFYTSGTYRIEGDGVRIALEFVFYESPRTLFGSRDKAFKLEIIGERENGLIRGELHRLDKPDRKLLIHFNRQADLPLTPN